MEAGTEGGGFFLSAFHCCGIVTLVVDRNVVAAGVEAVLDTVVVRGRPVAGEANINGDASGFSKGLYEVLALYVGGA